MTAPTTSTEARNLATVQAVYEAFGRGDVPAILGALAGDCAWEQWAGNSAQAAGVPWMQAGTGKDGATTFFQIIGQWQPHDFQVRSLMAGGDQVAAEIQASFTVANGKTFADEEMHLWTFNDAGQVSRFRHYLDTAKHIEVAK